MEVSSSQQRLATQLSMLPLLLVLAALTGGMQIAIDSTAGERERGSLEPLLLNPVSRDALAAGKWLAASLFGCCAVLFSMVLTVNVMRRVPWHDLGIRFRSRTRADELARARPAAGAVSQRDRDVRVDLRAVVQGSAELPRHADAAADASRHRLDDVSAVGRPWLAPVPVLGQYALAADVLGGKPPGVAFYVLAGVSAIACALVLVALTARLLRREAIVFGR